MKRKSLISLLLLVLLSGGCNNKYTVKTRIHPDGSFEKTIVCEGDSLGIYKLSLPFVFTDGWKIEIQKKTTGDNAFVTTATKRYSAPEDLQNEFTRGLDSSKLKIVSNVEKRFRWFFTYYIYQETIPAFSLFKQIVPINSVFTPEEMEALRNGKDSVLNKRLDEYWTRNIVDGFIDDLIARTQEMNDPLLTPLKWKEKRNFIAESLITKELSSAAATSEFIERTFQAPRTPLLRNAIDTLFYEILEKAKREKDLEIAYTNEVVMPGILITSNAKTVEGNTLKWDCRPHRDLDVVMTAESRMINLWAFVVSGFVCFALLAILLVPMIRMKKRPS
jgi:hypothetical protein